MTGIDFSAGYVSGVLCSDGNIVWNEKYGNYAFSLETKDGEFAELFMRNLNSVIDKEARLGTHKRRYNGQYVQLHTVSVYGKAAVGGFVGSWGISKEKAWSVPKVAFENAEFRRGFLAGFCDGNGNVSVNTYTDKSGKTSKKRSVRLYSVNESGLRGIKAILETEGIRSLFYPAGKCFSISISGKTRLQLFSERIGFSLSRKRLSLENALLAPSLAKA